MEQQMLTITNSGVKKRVKRELQLMIRKNICIEQDILVKQNNDTSYKKYPEYEVIFKNLNDNKYYKFIIPYNYPFKHPKLYIDNKYINFKHNTMNSEFCKKLKQYTGIQCFCCETILCSNNWSPGFTMISVLEEIDKYREARHQIAVRIIIDVIKRKYLIDDINIIEWLY